MGLLAARELLLGVVLLVLRRHGYGPLQVSFVGKAATLTLFYAFPLLFLGAHPASYAEVARVAVGRSPSGERPCTGGRPLLYVEQARRLLASCTGGAGGSPRPPRRPCRRRPRRPSGWHRRGAWRAPGTKERWAAVKAVVMAGGEGTRLRPMTANQPKPLLPVVNKPIMEHVLRLLRKHGFDETVVTVQFLASMVRNYFGDGEEFGMSLQYATEDTPLGTAGSVKNAEDALRDEPFLVISGDALTDIDLTEMVRFHKDNGALVTVGLTRVPDPLEFGIVIADEDGRIQRFLEKPTWGQVFSDTVNTGIYVMEPEVLDDVPAGEVVDWSGDVFPRLLERGAPVYGWVADGYWEDVGTHESYLQGAGRRAGRPGRRRHRRVRGVAGRLGGRGRRGRPGRGADRAAVHRRLRQDRGRRAAARVHRGRQQRRGQGGRVPAPRGRAQQRLRRASARPCAAA